MKLLGRIPLLIALAFLSFQSKAESSDSCAELGRENGEEVFRKYLNLQPIEMKRRCKLFDPTFVSDSKIERTQECVHSLEKLQNLAKRQMDERKRYCEQVILVRTCDGDADQSTCFRDQTNLQSTLSESRKKMRDIAESFREGLEEIEKFKRLWRNRIQRDQFAIDWGLANGNIFQQTNHPASESINEPPTVGANPPSQNTTSGISLNPLKPSRSPTSPTRSNISDSRGNPRDLPDPRDLGFQTLKEYRDTIPHLLNNLDADLTVVETETKIIHEVKALYQKQSEQSFELAAQTSKLKDQLSSLKENEANDSETQRKQQKKSGALEINSLAPHHAASPNSRENSKLKTYNSSSESTKAKLSKKRLSQQSPLEIELAESSAQTEYLKLQLASKAGKKKSLAGKELLELRQKLKNRLASRKQRASETAWIAEVIQESRSLSQVNPTSSERNQNSNEPLDVEGAFAEMNSQVLEILASEGVLPSDSPSLFLRVKARLQILEHTLR